MGSIPDLSVSIAGLPRTAGAPWSAGPRAAIAWADSLGVRAVTLDGTAAGLRARELDRSARRDLAGFLRRSELALAGIDLWIPPPHFEDPAHGDRALAALAGALELASDLAALGAGGAIVTAALPDDHGVRAAAGEAGERVGALVADAGYPAASETLPGVGVSLDPAAVIAAGDDPGEGAARLGARLVSARLSDLSGGGRHEPGTEGGRLDVAAYALTLATTARVDHVVCDPRGLPDPTASMARAIERWRSASPI